VDYINSFLSDRTTRLRLNGYTGPFKGIRTGIFQGAKLSPILFIVFAHQLLRVCENVRLRTSGIGFVNDTTIMIYEDTTEYNCEMLKKIYKRCLK